MDLNDVSLFVRIVETGSFAAVAAELGMQRSSVSRAMARLEQALGVRLLQRTTRKLALTDAGQAFFDQVRGAVASMGEAMNTVREFGGEPRGTVRVSVPPDAQTLGLAHAFTEFTRKYPAILVELNLTGRLVDLVGEGFDLAVRAGRMPDSALIARRIGATQLLFFAAPGYLKTAGVPQTLTELNSHDCILFRSHKGKATLHLTGPDGEESVEVQGRMSADEMAFILDACIAGAGVALLPTELARKAAQAGRIEHILPAYHQAGGSVYVVLPSSTLVPSRVALLRDHLVSHLERELLAAQNACTAAHASALNEAPPSELRRASPRRTRPRAQQTR
jgi:DNA-binding transcriptional LysR family regulator